MIPTSHCDTTGVKDHKTKLKRWSIQVTKLKAAAKASCLGFPDAKRVLEANDDTHENALWNLLDALKVAADWLPKQSALIH